MLLGWNTGDTDEATGGASTHAHGFTQPGAHSDHAALSHSAHAGCAVANHSFTQPSAHGTISSHAGTAVGTSGAGGSHLHSGPSHTHDYTQVPNHVHVENINTATTGGLSGFPALVDTSTSGSAALGLSTANPTGGVATGTTVAGGTGNTGAESAHTHAAGTVTQPSDHSALTNNHSGGAVDAHGVTQASAHSDHAAQSHSAHSGGAVADGTNAPPYIIVRMWKRTA